MGRVNPSLSLPLRGRGSLALLALSQSSQVGDLRTATGEIAVAGVVGPSSRHVPHVVDHNTGPNRPRLSSQRILSD